LHIDVPKLGRAEQNRIAAAMQRLDWKRQPKKDWQGKVVPMNTTTADHDTTTADHGRLSYRVPARECIDTPWIVSRGQPWYATRLGSMSKAAGRRAKAVPAARGAQPWCSALLRPLRLRSFTGEKRTPLDQGWDSLSEPAGRRCADAATPQGARGRRPEAADSKRRARPRPSASPPTRSRSSTEKRA
jgi:hypothetical protein